MTALRCERVFGLVTLQDGGRPGHRHRGVPLGGAADAVQARVARALVGHLGAGPVLEFAGASAQLSFTEPVVVAWAGARAELKVDGRAVASHTRLHVPAEAALSVSGPYLGRFGYLAVAGDWGHPELFGSVSPVRLGTEWVPRESVLRTGDSLRLSMPTTTDGRRVRAQAPDYSGPVEVDLWPAPESGHYREWRAGGVRLLAAGVPALREMIWRVASDSDRVGLRLRHPLGARAVSLLGHDPIRSSPTLPGTVQVTPHGELIVGLADGPTMGGYPRIGTVSAADLSAVAQATAGVRLNAVE